MRKVLNILIVISGVAFSALYFLKNYAFWEISPREIIPKFTIPQKNIKQYLPQGSDLNYPLTLPSGFNLGIFMDLKGLFPRALAFDEAGRLFASIPSKGKIVAIPDEDGEGERRQNR